MHVNNENIYICCPNTDFSKGGILSRLNVQSNIYLVSENYTFILNIFFRMTVGKLWLYKKFHIFFWAKPGYCLPLYLNKKSYFPLFKGKATVKAGLIILRNKLCRSTSGSSKIKIKMVTCSTSWARQFDEFHI